jgi:NTP pyrophosphatase (non-canonical NTP hydrolase)
MTTICPNCGRSFEDHTTCGCWIPISGEMTSPKSCAGGGLPEHWTAIEARKNREATIRKDEREKVLDILRPDVLHFALSMEKKLRKHDDRGGWKDCGIDWLFERLLVETCELGEDVKKYTRMNVNTSDVAREADDVGNFAMMIHSNTTDTTIEGLLAELRQAGEPC